MKICFIQSGGFAGTITRYQVDTRDLPASEAEQLNALMRDSGMPSSGRFLDEHAYDLRQYELTVEDQRDSFCLIFDDHNIPEAARPLLAFLQKQARPGPAHDPT